MAIPKYLPHYTVADYRQWEGDWELWNGVPVAMTPSPFGPHQRIVAELCRRFLNAIDDAKCTQCGVFVELDWIIHDDTVVRPDLSIVCNRPIVKFIDVPPALVAEVLSASTASKDRTSKRELYARCGVGHYLIVDPDTQAIELLRLAGDRYEPASLDQSINLTNTCQITLEFRL